MVMVFGVAARMNNEGVVSKAQRKRFSRAVIVSSINSTLFTIVLFLLAVTGSQYYSPWWLVLPTAINLICLNLVLSPSENP